MSADDSKPQSPFPPVRRIVTGHTPTGESTVLVDTVLTPRRVRPDAATLCYDLHYSGEAPAHVDVEITSADGKWVDEITAHTHEIAPASGVGSNFRCWDFPPGEVSPLHRTVTLDYGIVFRGQVTLELETGERLALKEGDTVIQRGTMHTWRNESTEWCKMYFVMLGAKPVEVNGTTLGQEFHEAK